MHRDPAEPEELVPELVYELCGRCMNPCTVGNTYKCERDCRDDRKIIQVFRGTHCGLGCAAPACNGKSVREGPVRRRAPAHASHPRSGLLLLFRSSEGGCPESAG